MTTPRVLIHYDVDGDVTFAATPGVELICVDENAGDDRVYYPDDRVDDAYINGVIGDE